MDLMEHGAFEESDKSGDLEILTRMLGDLSLDYFFEDFEDRIEWGGYDYDHEDDGGLDGHGGVV